MDKNIGSFGKSNQIGIRTGISAEDNTIRTHIKTVPKRRLNRAMVHGESRHTHSTWKKKDTLVHCCMNIYFGAFGRKLLGQIAPYVNICFIKFQNPVCDSPDPIRTIQLKRPAASKLPCCVKQVR